VVQQVARVVPDSDHGHGCEGPYGHLECQTVLAGDLAMASVTGIDSAISMSFVTASTDAREDLICLYDYSEPVSPHSPLHNAELRE